MWHPRLVAKLVSHKAVALMSNHCVRADNRVFADRYVRINADTRSENRARRDFDVGSQSAERFNHNAFTDLHIALNNRQWRDSGRGRDLALSYPWRVTALVTNEAKHESNRCSRIA